jgi:hypothetical protein
MLKIISVLALSATITAPALAEGVTTESLIEDYEHYNSLCRGGSGDKTSTWEACGARNYSLYILNQIGVCYGRDDEAGYQHQWHTCANGSLRLTARPNSSVGEGHGVSSPSTSHKLNFQTAFMRLPKEQRENLQGSLMFEGYYEGHIDGSWGPMTEHALLSLFSRFDKNGFTPKQQQTLEEHFIEFLLSSTEWQGEE